MKRESESRIAATTAAAAAVVMTFISILTLKSRIMNDEDDVTDEIFFEMTALNLRYASLSQNEIVRIFHNKFKSINLYRLRHMRELQFDRLNDLNRVEIVNEMLKLKKTTRTYKNFESSFHEIWFEFFLNYISIMISRFEKEISNLYIVLTTFHNDVYQLSRVYEWQNALLSMIIEMHIYIIITQLSNSVKWVIRLEF
jgi:hypothetical protein